MAAFLEWVVGIVALLLSISWLYGVRTYLRSGQSVTVQTATQTFLFWASLVLVLIVGLSTLHLLWMFPVSWILGLATIVFPFSLLQPGGHLVLWVATIGLDRAELADRARTFEEMRLRVEELLCEGHSQEETKAIIKTEFGDRIIE